jgi:hypothetical protein
MKKQIQAISNDKKPLVGYIEVLNKTSESAYVVWRIFDMEQRMVASFTNNYFFEGKKYSDEAIFERVKDQILKYRVGRDKIFCSIEFVRET